jgi:dihydroorotase
METVIRNAAVVNEGVVEHKDILIRGERIEKIGSVGESAGRRIEIDAQGMLLFPGVIDDQVHFRQPGLTHKGDIHSESRAGVAGGTTSYMEMPNTNPQTITQELLAEKFRMGDENSMANFSFFMGVTNHNRDEVLRTDPQNVCGIKIFMGSSTGDMLVDDTGVLRSLFSEAPVLIAVHCEDEGIIRKNSEEARTNYGENVSMKLHPSIRNAEACYKSSSTAIDLAKKHGTRLHVLHISTAAETELFENNIPLAQKMITAEACVHHLWFTDADYETKGALIKWNPAIKSDADRQAIRKALLDGRIDIVATDHAPHTAEEKERSYFNCPSGGPLIQHSLVAMLEFVQQGWMTPAFVAEKMAHAPATIYNIAERGYIREGYYADLVLVHMNTPWKVTSENLYYKCGWSPFEGQRFHASVDSTFVNGACVYQKGKFMEEFRGKRLRFNRNR